MKLRRNKLICELWIAGNTLEHIGSMFGISKARVQQIVVGSPYWTEEQVQMRNDLIKKRLGVENRWVELGHIGYVLEHGDRYTVGKTS